MQRCIYLLWILIVSNQQLCSTPDNGWHNTHSIWNFGIIAACDSGLNKDPYTYFATNPSFEKDRYINAKPGEIVWLQCRFLGQFCKEVLPELQSSIVLVIADGDESFPSQGGKDFFLPTLLNHPCIIHIFAQNYECFEHNSKISHLPIGMDFHTIAYKSKTGGWGEKGDPHVQEQKLTSILQNLKPTYLRKKRAFVDFQLSDSAHGEFQRYLQYGEDRKSIFERLLKTGLIDYGSWMPRSSLWRKKGEYAFSISPHGNGLDCHRTWEDLILGCIVIVKTSGLDPLYEGLPVVIVRDWSDITADNLEQWLIQFGDAFTNHSYRERLTHAYWFSKIAEKAKPYKRDTRD